MSQRTVDFGGGDFRVTEACAFLSRQLTEFRSHFDEHPMSEEQDLRAYSIAWLAAFVPEAFSAGFRADLESFVAECGNRDDFSHNGWWRLPGLDVALFLVTKDAAWLNVCRENLDHHKSGLRLGVMEALALAAQHLIFDEEMLRRVAHNLQVRQMGCGDVVVLFVACQNKNEDKIAKVSEWLSAYSHNEGVEETLRVLENGRSVPNAFLFHLLWIQRYV